MTAAEAAEKAIFLRDCYSSDLELSFVDKCLHFGEHCSSRRSKRDIALNVCKWMRDLLSVYPDVEIVLRIPVRN
jgi:hypothetical protein